MSSPRRKKARQGRRQGNVTHQSVPASDAPYMRSTTSGLSLNDSVYERLLRERIIVLGTQVERTSPTRSAAAAAAGVGTPSGHLAVSTRRAGRCRRAWRLRHDG